MWYKKRKIVVFILSSLLILLALLAYKIYSYIPEPFYKPNVVYQKSLQQHTLKKYGYSFQYTNDYVMQGHAPEPIPPKDDSFYFHRNRKNEPILNSTISIYKIGVRKNQELLDFAKQHYNEWLSFKHRSGKLEPPHSGRIIEAKNYHFVTPYGINGYESYFRIEDIEDENPTNKSYYRMGPYITFEFANNVDGSFVVFKIMGGDTSEGREAINLFLNSLKPTESP